MRKLLYFLVICLAYSCVNFTPKYAYEISYSFDNAENISNEAKRITLEVIKKRLSKFSGGVDVTMDSKDEILIKLKSDFKIERINNIILNEGKLDFWPCYSHYDVFTFLSDADKLNQDDEKSSILETLVQSYSDKGLITVKITDTVAFNTFINQENIKTLFKEDFKHLKFLYDEPVNGYINIYGVKTNDKGRALVNEGHITEVIQDFDQLNRPGVSINMNDYGAYSWEKVTNDAYRTGTCIAICLNDVVRSAPTVSNGAIKGGRSQISGDFSLEEAQNLSYILSSHKRIPKLKFLQVTELEK
ncbi:hypothetical protein [uncultured Winogradskyella sp.]|uniref:SecDF P1 head subdomain-containing protein n=1 Tax=Winogradskyella sp. 4-2091 TaxID=3381659 RepID=UPI00263685E3|nr:hypothetical protein [uncultured Winogradskyella sp.]